MKKSELPPTLSKLCNRVANEHFKPQIWRLASEMRLEFEARLGAGEALDAAERELMSRLRAAVVEQFRR